MVKCLPLHWALGGRRRRLERVYVSWSWSILMTYTPIEDEEDGFFNENENEIR